MIRFLVRLVSIALATAGTLFVIMEFIPELGFVIKSTQTNTLSVSESIRGLLIVGAFVWFGMEIVASFLKILTLPLKRFTLGISNIIVNIVILYGIEYILKYHLEVGYEIVLGNIAQTIVLSFVLGLILSVLTRIIKRFI